MKIRCFWHQTFGSLQQSGEIFERHHSSNRTDYQCIRRNTEAPSHGITHLGLRAKLVPVYSVIKNADSIGVPPSLCRMIIAQLLANDSDRATDAIDKMP